jgi:predicted ATPase
MQVNAINVSGYRSIRDSLTVHLDPRVTVLLGANDHGKSNILQAILHLNADHAFEQERDLNWDVTDTANFPAISFRLELDDDERTEVLARIAGSDRISTLTSFVDTLSAEVDDAREVVERATADLDAAEAERAALSKPAEDETPAQAEDRQANVAALSAAVDAADEQVGLAAARLTLAEQRAALGDARLLALQARRDHGVSDIATLAAAAQDAADSAAAQREAARLAVRSAETDHKEALEEHAEDSDVVSAAAARLEEARAALKSADKDLLRTRTEATRLTAASSALDREAAGELAFSDELEEPRERSWTNADLPQEIVLERKGVDGALAIVDCGNCPPGEFAEWLMPRLPRVELILPHDALADAVDVDSITESEQDFMRGIFYYAGLERDEWASIFTQDYKTTKRLSDASFQLNETLQRSWSQGQELQFNLVHMGDEIALMIRDPAVHDTFVRASRRSSGFTHFFALKTVLHARQRESGARSFIWLFDEPGIYLHPEGQFDLLQVLETLAQANQLLYSTHSIFLVNKNYPSRHRLIKKDAFGTTADEKPYVGRWHAALDALGLGLAGTVLFASKVLLVEGDSDPILLNADLQKLVQLDLLDIDLNPLSILATGNSEHAGALIRILDEGITKPQIALLFDGDKGGIDRHRALKRVIEAKSLEAEVLTPKDSTLEDHLLAPELYREATVRFTEALRDDLALDVDVRTHLESSFPGGGRSPSGLAKWARSEGQAVLGTSNAISSIGIAREYARLLEAASPDQLGDRRRPTALARRITQMLDLRPRTRSQDEIIEPQRR